MNKIIQKIFTIFVLQHLVINIDVAKDLEEIKKFTSNMHFVNDQLIDLVNDLFSFKTYFEKNELSDLLKKIKDLDQNINMEVQKERIEILGNISQYGDGILNEDQRMEKDRKDGKKRDWTVIESQTKDKFDINIQKIIELLKKELPETKDFLQNIVKRNGNTDKDSHTTRIEDIKTVQIIIAYFTKVIFSKYNEKVKKFSELEVQNSIQGIQKTIDKLSDFVRYLKEDTKDDIFLLSKKNFKKNEYKGSHCVLVTKKTLLAKLQKLYGPFFVKIKNLDKEKQDFLNEIIYTKLKKNSLRSDIQTFLKQTLDDPNQYLAFSQFSWEKNKTFEEKDSLKSFSSIDSKEENVIMGFNDSNSLYGNLHAIGKDFAYEKNKVLIDKLVEIKALEFDKGNDISHYGIFYNKNFPDFGVFDWVKTKLIL